MDLHLATDAAAWLVALGAGLAVRRRWPVESVVPRARRPFYLLAVITGALLGAFCLGTLNLTLAGVPGIGRSVLGALVGAIIAVEIYKVERGITGSTGGAYVVPLALGIAVGRGGCLLTGLDDFTYGTPTGLPWGWDFGDGVPRHPVALYESLSMLAFLCLYLPLLARRHGLVLRHGFYLFAGVYGAQRFAWEFLKPYPTLVGPLNLFHFACLGLVAYALVMARREEKALALV